MSFRAYAAVCVVLAVLGFTLSDRQRQAPGELGAKCSTPHHGPCADGLACIRHRCALPCVAEPGSNCAPALAR